jgi:TP901 family phage tail tape measure protein
MPTLSELRVRGTYDGKDLKQGMQQAKAEVLEAGRAIKASADQAEAGVKAAHTKMGQAYAALPVAARRAYDEAISAQTQYQQRLTQGMTAVGTAMSLGITVPFGLFARESARLGMEFEQTMDVLQASIQGTTRDMSKLRAEAVALGGDITLPATSANDAARAMNALAKGGLAVDNVLKAARGTMQLAAAAGIDAAEAATIQARALSAFQLEGDKATRVADLLAKATYSSTGTIQDMALALQQASAVMKQSGQTIDDTVASISLLAKAGIVGQDAGTSIKTMFLRLQEGNSIAKVRDLMKAYGIEVYDASGRMKSMRDIIAEFTPMVQHLTQEQRNAAFAVMFGSDAIRAANVVLGGGVEAFDAMTTKLADEGAAAELAAARNKGLAGALDGLKSAWETLMQQSAEPLLNQAAALTRSVAGLVGAMADMDPTARGIILSLAAIAAAAGPVLIVTAQLKAAWLTLFGLRTAAVAATAAATASEAALATATQAEAVAASEAAAAETALAAASRASGAAAATGAAQKGVAVAANQAVAASASAAATATMAGSAAATTAAGSTGLLGTAMAALASPVGLVTIAVLALAAALYGLHKWSVAEAEQAEANARAFRAEYTQAYESAKAKVELKRQTKDLLAEYEQLAGKTRRSNDEQRRYQSVANELSLLMPELVKKYTNQGDAILDVAKAHAEAARQAQNHYEKEMQLARARLNIMDASDAAQKASDLRDMGAGRSLSELQRGVSITNGSMFNIDPSIWGDDPRGPLLQAIKNRVLEERKLAIGQGSNEAVEAARREEIRAATELNDQLRKTLAEGAKLRREAAEEQRKAKLGPEGYAKYLQEQAAKAREAQIQKDVAQRIQDAKYQAEVDKRLKAAGYGGVADLTKAEGGKAGGGSSAPTYYDLQQFQRFGRGAIRVSERAHHGPDGRNSRRINADLVDTLGQIADEFGMEFLVSSARRPDSVNAKNRKGPSRHGIGSALDIAAINGHALTTAEGKRLADLVDKRLQEMGYFPDSESGKDRAVLWRTMAGGNHYDHLHASSTRKRGAKGIGKVGAEDSAVLQAWKEAEAEARRQIEEAKQKQAEVDQSFQRVKVAIAAATDEQQKYADMLGLTLDRYKQLKPEEKERAARLHGMLSGTIVDRELKRMRESSAAEAMNDPTEKALAQFKLSLADRRDLTDADKAKLIEERRTQLVQQRSAELAKEVTRLQQEKQLVEAVTEQERIRLRLMMARPDLKASELEPLARAEYEKFQAEQRQRVAEELAGKQGATSAAAEQLKHDQAIHAIQANLALTEQERYRLIQDQNDALELQLFLLEQQARVSRGEITPEQQKQLVEAEKLRIEQSRLVRDQVHGTEQVQAAQDRQRQLQADNMERLADDARQQASGLVDILMRPFEDGLGKGFKGFWNSLVDGWRQTIRQMFLEWARSQLMRSLEPLFQGRDLRRYRAEQSARFQAQREADAELVAGGLAGQVLGAGDARKVEVMQAQVRATEAAARATSEMARAIGNPDAAASSIMPGETSGVPNGMKIGGNIDMFGALASVAMLAGGGGRKRSLLTDAIGIVGLLSSVGAFGKGGFLTSMFKGMRFAAGGDVPMIGQPVLVGEYGPELWTPPSSGGRMHNSSQTQQLLQSGAPIIHVTQNITTPDTVGFRRASGQVASEMAAAIGRQRGRNFTGR